MYGQIVSEKMTIHTNKLDINKFKKDFATLYKGRTLVEKYGDAEQVLETVVGLVNESDCSIPSFLRSVDSIDGKEIQRYCRHAAIAQMYNAGLNYNRCSSCYVETSPYGEAILIKLPVSTVVLSKYGDILINEGVIWTHSGLNYGRGWITRKIIDGQASNKYGFIDNSGTRVLPCVFDYIEGHIGSPIEIYFGYFTLILNSFVKIDSVDREKIQEMIDDYRPKNIYCLSEDSILSKLIPFHYRVPVHINETMAIENNKHSLLKRDELMYELRTALSPILISKERLQEIVDSK